MATHRSIAPELIERAFELNGEYTKNAAETLTREAFIARRRQRGLVDLIGKLEWDPAFDVRRERVRGSKNAPAPCRPR